MKKLKAEYQPGGSKRNVILDKAVQYLKDPKFGLDPNKFKDKELGLEKQVFNLPEQHAGGGS